MRASAKKSNWDVTSLYDAGLKKLIWNFCLYLEVFALHYLKPFKAEWSQVLGIAKGFNN